MDLGHFDIFYEFLKGQKSTIGTTSEWGGIKYIKVADVKGAGRKNWKRYGAEHAAKEGKQVKQKIRGRKGSRPEKGVAQRSFILFNRKNQRKVKSYLFKGKLGHYQADKGIPKSGKVIVVDFKARKAIGEAHTKKGVEKLLRLHSGDREVMPLAYIPKRGRPSGSRKKRPQRAA